MSFTLFSPPHYHKFNPVPVEPPDDELLPVSIMSERLPFVPTRFFLATKSVASCSFVGSGADTAGAGFVILISGHPPPPSKPIEKMGSGGRAQGHDALGARRQ